MIPLLLQLAFALALGYFFLILYLLRHESPQAGPPAVFPTIAVMVAFRNEEHQIGRCVEALKQLDYPRDCLTVFLLDDQSTDRSAEIVREAIEGHGYMRYVYVDHTLPGLNGKMNAVALGIKMTDAELIATTDADCAPNPEWLKKLSSHFDASTGMVSGFTTIAGDENGTLLNKMQQVDWLFIQALAVGAANGGKPISVIGNNLMYRRKLYQALGGYEAIGFSVDEDHALMKEIVTKTHYAVKYLDEPESVVVSHAYDRFMDFVNQRVRWARGGLNARPFAWLVVGASFLAHWLIPLLFFSGHYNIITGTAIGMIVGVDYMMLKRHMRKLQLEHLRASIIKYEVFQLIYTALIALIAPFRRRIIWKGRSYTKV